MVRLIDQQRVIIGTLKAIGYSDFQIFLHYTKFALGLGLVSGLIGLALGHAMGYFVISLYRMFYEFPNLEAHVYFAEYGGGLAVALLWRLVGSLQGARGASGSSGRGDASQAAGARRRHLARALCVVLGAIALRLAAGAAKRVSQSPADRGRHVCHVDGRRPVVCGFILASAIVYLISFQFQLVTHSDVDLRFKDEHGLPALYEASRLPGVDFAEPVFDVSCTFIHGPYRRQGAIRGMLTDSRLTVPRDIDGRPIRIPDTGLAMSSKLARLLGVRAGDLITVLPTKGERNEIQVPVAELSDSYIGLAVYADIHYLSRLMDEELAINGVQLALQQSPASQAALYKELKQLPALQSVNARSDVIENLEFIMRTQRIFITFIVVFAGVIFFQQPVEHRANQPGRARREVATLRARLQRVASGRAVFARKPGGQFAGHAGGTAAGLWPGLFSVRGLRH